MVSPRGSMESVARAIARSDEVPSDLGLSLQEADTDNDDANIDMPLVEIQPVDVEHVVVNNDDLVGYVTDDEGNRVGKIYFSEYEMEIDINLWTTKGDGYDPDDLGERLRKALYPHSSYGPQQSFLAEDGEEIDQITYFRLGEGERADDLIQTPTVRKWSQTVELWGCEEFRTNEDYIASVDYPASGDFNDSDNDGVIEDT